MLEGALVAQLRDSSDDFLTLGDFRALWGQVSRTGAQVRALRTKLRDTQSGTVEKVPMRCLGSLQTI